MTPTSPISSPLSSPTSALRFRCAESVALRVFRWALTAALILLGALLARHNELAGTLVGVAAITLYTALRRADPRGIECCLDPSGDWLRPAQLSNRVIACRFVGRGPMHAALWVECRYVAAVTTYPKLRVFIVCADALDEHEWRLLRARLQVRHSNAQPRATTARLK